MKMNLQLIFLGVVLYGIYLAGFVTLSEQFPFDDYKYATELALVLSAISLRSLYQGNIRKIIFFLVSAMLIPGIIVYIFLVPRTPPEAVPALGVFLGYCSVYVFFPNAIAIVVGWVIVRQFGSSGFFRYLSK